MRFNSHSELEGRHAFLSPSNYHWINYTDQKLEARYLAHRQAAKGTALHEFAHAAIRLQVNLPDDGSTLSLYVNDGIEYGMTVEQALYYSDNCYGHADTLCFTDDLLRIHDLKTGVTAASIHQLEVYAALFCLEYIISPFEIGVELRIYQNDEVLVDNPVPELVSRIMEKIVSFDMAIDEFKARREW